ncbi:hypothetical protein PsYK624_065210 [Phanerochaete sordida]|uniref:Uncharacterized protein n=1 Tax=Phanerochaete sordida TaxID=48140 RepID=A0A9P3GAI7_9APHY|nr:hypothetical protein PsYK624_065210 [Phanerochaete sordida]
MPAARSHPFYATGKPTNTTVFDVLIGVDQVLIGLNGITIDQLSKQDLQALEAAYHKMNAKFEYFFDVAAAATAHQDNLPGPQPTGNPANNTRDDSPVDDRRNGPTRFGNNEPRGNGGGDTDDDNDDSDDDDAQAPSPASAVIAPPVARARRVPSPPPVVTGRDARRFRGATPPRRGSPIAREPYPRPNYTRVRQTTRTEISIPVASTLNTTDIDTAGQGAALSSNRPLPAPRPSQPVAGPSRPRAPGSLFGAFALRPLPPFFPAAAAPPRAPSPAQSEADDEEPEASTSQRPTLAWCYPSFAAEQLKLARERAEAGIPEPGPPRSTHPSTVVGTLTAPYVLEQPGRADEQEEAAEPEAQEEEVVEPETQQEEELEEESEQEPEEEETEMSEVSEEEDEEESEEEEDWTDSEEDRSDSDGDNTHFEPEDDGDDDVKREPSDGPDNGGFDGGAGRPARFRDYSEATSSTYNDSRAPSPEADDHADDNNAGQQDEARAPSDAADSGYGSLPREAAPVPRRSSPTPRRSSPVSRRSSRRPQSPCPVPILARIRAIRYPRDEPEPELRHRIPQGAAAPPAPPAAPVAGPSTRPMRGLPRRRGDEDVKMEEDVAQVPAATAPIPQAPIPQAPIPQAPINPATGRPTLFPGLTLPAPNVPAGFTAQPYFQQTMPWPLAPPLSLRVAVPFPNPAVFDDGALRELRELRGRAWRARQDALNASAVVCACDGGPCVCPLCPFWLDYYGRERREQ